MRAGFPRNGSGRPAEIDRLHSRSGALTTPPSVPISAPMPAVTRAWIRLSMMTAGRTLRPAQLASGPIYAAGAEGALHGRFSLELMSSIGASTFTLIGHAEHHQGHRSSRS